MDEFDVQVTDEMLQAGVEAWIKPRQHLAHTASDRRQTVHDIYVAMRAARPTAAETGVEEPIPLDVVLMAREAGWADGQRHYDPIVASQAERIAELEALARAAGIPVREITEHDKEGKDE